jgi:hypothetical protein
MLIASERNVFLMEASYLGLSACFIFHCKMPDCGGSVFSSLIIEGEHGVVGE